MRMLCQRIISGQDMRQPGADGAVDESTELAVLARLILETVPEVRAFAKERERGSARQVGGAHPQRLPGVTALMGKNLAGTGQTKRPGTRPALPVTQPAA